MSMKKIGSFIGQTVLTLATISAVAVGSNYVRQAVAKPAMTVEAALAQSPEVFALFQEKYPVEYTMMIGDLSVAIAQGTSLFDVTNSHIVEWRQQNVADMGLASDENLTAVLTNYVDLLKLVETKGGSELCGNMLISGTGVLVQAVGEIDGLMAQLETQLIDTMTAVASGRDEPAKRKPISDKDWDDFFVLVTDQGATAEELQAIVDVNAQDPLFCSASIMMIETMLGEDSAAMERVRADYAMAIMLS